MFNFKRTSNKQTKNTRIKKAKEIEEDIIPRKSIKKKCAAARVKIFLIARISGNKSNLFFGLNEIKNVAPFMRNCFLLIFRLT